MVFYVRIGIRVGGLFDSRSLAGHGSRERSATDAEAAGFDQNEVRPCTGEAAAESDVSAADAACRQPTSRQHPRRNGR